MKYFELGDLNTQYPKSFFELIRRQQALASYGYDVVRIFKKAGWERIALWGGVR